MISAPTGIVVTLLLWLAMGERWTTARTIIAGLLASAALILSAVAAYFRLSSDQSDQGLAGIWILAAIGCIVTLATAGILRFQGWRVVRIPRQGKRPAAKTPA